MPVSRGKLSAIEMHSAALKPKRPPTLEKSDAAPRAAQRSEHGRMREPERVRQDVAAEKGRVRHDGQPEGRVDGKSADQIEAKQSGHDEHASGAAVLGEARVFHQVGRAAGEVRHIEARAASLAVCSRDCGADHFATVLERGHVLIGEPMVVFDDVRAGERAPVGDVGERRGIRSLRLDHRTDQPACRSPRQSSHAGDAESAPGKRSAKVAPSWMSTTLMPFWIDELPKMTFEELWKLVAHAVWTVGNLS